ncbi:hypothetical protein HDU93_002258 [Gonapodya sp. JEL0774]|nr:hypothetical protein HDU93_002258 [Gonapodya sp. JEL0774]
MGISTLGNVLSQENSYKIYAAFCQCVRRTWAKVYHRETFFDTDLRNFHQPSKTKLPLQVMTTIQDIPSEEAIQVIIPPRDEALRKICNKRQVGRQSDEMDADDAMEQNGPEASSEGTCSSSAGEESGTTPASTEPDDMECDDDEELNSDSDFDLDREFSSHPSFVDSDEIDGSHHSSEFSTEESDISSESESGSDSEDYEESPNQWSKRGKDLRSSKPPPPPHNMTMTLRSRTTSSTVQAPPLTQDVQQAPSAAAAAQCNTTNPTLPQWQLAYISAVRCVEDRKQKLAAASASESSFPGEQPLPKRSYVLDMLDGPAAAREAAIRITNDFHLRYNLPHIMEAGPYNPNLTESYRSMESPKSGNRKKSKSSLDKNALSLVSSDIGPAAAVLSTNTQTGDWSPLHDLNLVVQTRMIAYHVGGDRTELAQWTKCLLQGAQRNAKWNKDTPSELTDMAEALATCVAKDALGQSDGNSSDEASDTDELVGQYPWGNIALRDLVLTKSHRKRTITAGMELLIAHPPNAEPCAHCAK